MRQEEIKEISQAFQQAWEDFFGAPMYYIPYDTNDDYDELYDENRSKDYKEAEAVLVHGTIKEKEDLDTTTPVGKLKVKHYTITLVTQELIDGGVTNIDTNSIIRHTDIHGVTTDYEIYDDYQKVQLGNNKIFTKLKVRSNG